MAGITLIPTNTNFEQFLAAVNDRFALLAGGDPLTGGGQTVAEAKAELLALIDAAKVYDQAGMAWGKPTAGGRVFFIPCVRTFTIPVNCAGSKARVIVAPTAQAVFTLKKSGANIGTATFESGVLVGTFVMASAQNFAPFTDYLEIIAPNPQDATLEDAGWNMFINWQ